ncbi:hypothetical protein PVL29_020796 [Vitis rotundifolia]|uniref:F-box/kelch-repeat protein n=1 Tax=Vitis rotundifolia TaxID=103349 RepID=A0AA38YY97_VITRO|nr:hypothetical protein PVL29_020796 [Vitis rotundifolia]
MDLIPGLPDDVARPCLICVSYEKFSTIAAVCRVWKNEVEDPDFFRQMKTARVMPNRSSGGMKCPMLAFRVTLLDPETGNWSEFLVFSDGLPMFCQLVGVESELVVVGGCVFIYNFVSATWRRGADMPGVRRSFFGCATSYSGRMGYVAGGHDGEKKALRSALVYDVAKNEWAMLPDMARERDECKAAFHRGKFHVIGGHCTEMQGGFERSAEAFDFVKCQWHKAEEDFLEARTRPKTCVDGSDMGMYMCHAVKLPAEIHHIAYMTTWQGKLLVIESSELSVLPKPFINSLFNHNYNKKNHH